MSGLPVPVLRLARHHLLPVLVDRDVHRHDDALGVLRLSARLVRSGRVGRGLVVRVVLLWMVLVLVLLWMVLVRVVLVRVVLCRI